MFYIVKLFENEFGREQFVYLNCEHRSVYPLKLEDLNYLITFVHQEGLVNYPSLSQGASCFHGQTRSPLTHSGGLGK
ncbi:MAG: hypothetical protein JTT16_02100 [Candidatus Brockarchaeota archaeon]|nr:hypothetical protein [Candidatus Brockarchaeota archaeon]MBO3768102.1 hypothetical protein [Candidatus Brockarchaeota archaeon]